MKPAASSSILAAALIVALVPLSPVRALADELPKDTNQIERLTPEQATVLAGSTAWDGQLRNLTTLDAATAAALAEFKGKLLCLNRLTTLDAATAKALAGSPAWNGDLSSITAFESPDSVETAAALANRKGPISLRNLTKISPKALTALIEKEDVDIPLIETLELIQEPDGSPTEDFMIPKGFQSRQKMRQQGR